jgi:chromosome segregation protein
MFLSKLELFGFKSFASKTELTFNGGITSVVGPNGCGKTNVLDSIRWVLGEQRTSMLRSDSMENVIFNGSQLRKALGMAEVTINIKNDKGLLPIDYSEVSITRRVFRSGESEYFINRNQCRLKDIQDMLMDSGMAPTAYSVIELKMVEDILRENTDERRRMFEEASGVTKYKARRKAALSKLEDVQRDLLRVNDLIAEIEKKVNSLERQAKKAEQYRRFTDELKLLERQYLFAEYRSVISRVAPLKDSLSLSESEKAKSLATLAQQEELLKLIRTEIEDFEKSISSLRQNRSEKQGELHSVEEEIAVLSERRRGLNERISSLENRKVDLTEKNSSLSSQIDELVLSLSEAEGEERAISDSLSAEQDTFRNFEQQLFSAREKSNRSHERLIQILNDVAVKQNDRERSHARLERVRSHDEELTVRLAQLEGEKAQLISRMEGARVERKKISDEIEKEKLKLTDLEAHREELFVKLGREREDLQTVRDRLKANEARVDFLNGLVEHLEGVPDGAKALARGEVPGLPKFEILSDIFYVEADYRVAAESVLGEASNFLVSPDEHTALSAVEALRKSDLGKVTFICLDKIAPPAAIENSSGQRRLTDHLQTSQEFDRVGRYFFENVAVVENFSEAERILAREPLITCVSFSGDMYSAKGVIKGGSTRKSEGGRVGKQRQLDELRVENQGLASEIADLEKDLTVLQSEIDTLPIKTGNETLRDLELQLARLEQSSVESERTLDGITTQIGDVRARISKLASEISEASADLERVETSLDEAADRKNSAEEEYQSTLEEVKVNEEAYRQKNETLREVQAKHIECANKLNFLKREIETSRQQVSANLEGIARADEDIETAKQTIEQSQVRLTEFEERRSSLRLEVDALDSQANEITVKLSVKKSTEEAEESRLREARTNHDAAVETVHQISLKISELDAHASAILERAKEEYNLDVSAQSAESMNLPAEFDVVASHERINYLKGRIESFGPVNLVAFSEYSEEKQRLDFLVAQRADLLEAEKTLTTTIDEINHTAHQKFKETFNQISENFKITFQSLFEGGESELRLEENVDPLEAKIEIMAKPAGKKPQSIDLLSAGEKTLTAIALLFAIYLVKPSPFCILDEVDGPLDDNNTDNFVGMIKRFSTDTQFIVITHNKRTMEAADTLYGVTMEEQGVSKVVAVRFIDDWVAKT